MNHSAFNAPQLLAMLEAVRGDQQGYFAFLVGDMVDGKLSNAQATYLHTRRLNRRALRKHLGDYNGERELYVSPLLYSDTARRKENAMPLAALYADGDGAEIPEDFPEPTVILQTSAGKHHYIWALEAPIDPEEGRQLNSRIARHLGADPSGADLAQLVRVPGTLNHKYEPAEAVKLLDLVDVHYDAALFDEILPPPAEKGRKLQAQPGVPTAEAKTTHPPVQLGGDDLARWQGEKPCTRADGSIDRSKTLFSIASSLARASATEAQIVEAIAERDQSLGFRKYVGRDDAELRYQEIAASVVSGQGPRFGETRPMTDMGNAERFVDRYGHDAKFTDGRGWLGWDGRRYRADGDAVRRMAMDTARAIQAEAEPFSPSNLAKRLKQHGRSSESRTRIDHQLDLARSMEMVHRMDDQFDQDPMLLNLANGTLDLRSGELREHRHEDLLTKLAPASWDPEARCPRWRRFLRETFSDDKDLIRYIQKLVGYCLTGRMDEQIIAIFYGVGANGKSTFLRTIQDLLGDYAHQLPAHSLLRRQNPGIGNEFVPLCGARLAVASELNEDQRFDEALVKQLTGGDKLSVRALYKDFITFTPTFKIVLATNKKPQISGTDHGIWRRVHLVPFEAVVPKENQDPQLAAKLQAEAPGILRWAMTGCRMWLEEGLVPPESVKAATEEFRLEMDTFGSFLHECTIMQAGSRVSSGELRYVYDEWRSGEPSAPELNPKAFGREMRHRGFEGWRDSKNRGYSGLKLKPAWAARAT